jgi:hypothetical protein
MFAKPSRTTSHNLKTKERNDLHSLGGSNWFGLSLCLVAASGAVNRYKCHPKGIVECGYKNQQWKFEASSGEAGTFVNVNSNTCLTMSGSASVPTFEVSVCKNDSVTAGR